MLCVTLTDLPSPFYKEEDWNLANNLKEFCGNMEMKGIEGVHSP
jgi:hypothetical protein